MSLRDLKIKTGVVKRTAKELAAYRKEAEKQQERINKLIADGADDADIKKQNEVLEETNQMFPDCNRRLVAAHKELTDLVAAITKGTDEGAKASEELMAAQAVLAEANV
ncbi:hypothetical protein HK104_004801 [Borealophlyctis nickersoniae]|nr:hypothetical protein HK104_004801 [Borealophlyctis nickersoniae]